MKNRLMILIFSVLTLSAAAQQKGSAFFQIVSEAQFSGSLERIKKAEYLLKNDGELRHIFDRASAILFENYTPFEKEIAFEDLELQRYADLQQSMYAARQSESVEGMRILDQLGENRDAFSSFELGYFFLVRGIHNSGLNQYKDALYFMGKAERSFEKSSSEIGVLYTKFCKNSLYLKFHRWKLATEFYEETQSEYGETLNVYPWIGANFSMIASSLGFVHERFETVRPSQEKAISLFRSYGDSMNVMKCYLNLGMFEATKNNMDEALLLFRKGVDARVKRNVDLQHIRFLVTIYGLLEDNSNYTAKLLEIFGVSSVRELESIIEEGLYKFDNQDLSLHYWNRKVGHYETNKDRVATIAALKGERDFLYDIIITDTTSAELVQYMLELEQAKTRQLSAEKKRAEHAERIQKMKLDRKIREQRYTFWSLFGITLFAVIFFIGRRQLIKVRKEKKNVSEKLSKSELELESLQQSISSKNRTMQELQERLSLSDTEQAEQVQALRAMKLLTENDWREFQQVSYSLYPNFTEVLSGLPERLTAGEERLLLLLRLNLSKNEVAEMLGVGAESVRKSNYRLRKKIAPLELDELLQKISTNA